MHKVIRGIMLIAVFCIGIFVGYTLLNEGEITGASTACFFNNEPCICNYKECVCGQYEIEAKECYDNFQKEIK